MSEFNYKQRPWSRAVSQAEWDRIFPAPRTQRIPTTHSPEAVVSSPSGDGSGRPADFVTKAGTRIFILAAPFVIPSTRYAVEFAEGCD
jgi:hypothetical protein